MVHMANMQAEVPGWDFDKVKADGQALWETALEKITVGGSVDRKNRIFIPPCTIP
jgi:putative alpha-1,2-mannosidase